MIPSKLTLYRWNEEKETTTIVEVYGLSETPPRAGHRFNMLTNEVPPRQIVTGIVGGVELLRTGEVIIRRTEKERKNRSVSGTGNCFFRTNNSTYRWERITDVPEEDPNVQ